MSASASGPSVAPALADGTSPGTLVSVVVPVRDRADSVARLADRLAAQSLPTERFEVIIADDGSSDHLHGLLGSAPSWIRITSGLAINAYAARNRAAELARGDLLAFIDADCLPKEDWLANGLEALRSADVVAGHIELLLPSRPSAWALIDATLFDQERFVAIGKAATANLFVRRALFEHHGGFDASLPSGGDWDFVERCVRGGARLRYARGAVVEHQARSTPREFLGRRWRIEHAMARRHADRGASLLRINSSRNPVVARRWGFAVGYDGQRLRDLGVTVGWLTRLRTLPPRYFVIPPIEALAQITGWIRARVRPAAPRR